MQVIFRIIAGYFIVMISAVVLIGPRSCDGPFYSVNLNREFSSPEEEALIMQAESLCPPYADVAASFIGTPPPPSGECLWWNDTEADRTYFERVPYAITSGAIDFFADRIHDWEMSPELEMPSSSLDYEARVLYGWTPPGKQSTTVPVAVEMHLDYWINTSPNGVIFELERIVAFDEHGTVLGVYGDGDLLFSEIVY